MRSNRARGPVPHAAAVNKTPKFCPIQHADQARNLSATTGRSKGCSGWFRFVSLLAVAGLQSGCLSSDSELSIQRERVRSLKVGLVSGGPEDCVGTLVRPNKVVTLEPCVRGTDAADLEFSSENGTESSVTWVTLGSPQGPPESHRGSWATLTISPSQSADEQLVWDTAPYERGPDVWLETFATAKSPSRVLFCVELEMGERADCGGTTRLPGGLVFAIVEEELFGVGLDRGAGRLIGFHDVAIAPERITSLATHRLNSFDAEVVELALVEPDWKRISHWGDSEQGRVDTPFSPSTIAYFEEFDDFGESSAVATDSDGQMWRNSGLWEEMDVPVSARQVASIPQAEPGAVIWLLGFDGSICRQRLLPTSSGWSCLTSNPSASHLAVAMRGAQEQVLLSTSEGLVSMYFQDGEISEAAAWGPDDEPATAAVFGQLQDRRQYALFSKANGELQMRLHDGEQWLEWSKFPAGKLPGAVTSLASGHNPGYPDNVYALIQGRLYQSVQIPTSGPMAIDHVDFDSWR